MSETIDKEEITLTRESDVNSEFRRFLNCALSIFDNGYACKLTLNPVKITRSVRQNALMWKLLSDISKQVNWHGFKLDSEDWKEVISASWREQRAVPKIGGGGFVVLGVSTRKLGVKEMAELLEVITAFGHEQGVKFSAPKWMYEEAK